MPWQLCYCIVLFVLPKKNLVHGHSAPQFTVSPNEVYAARLSCAGCPKEEILLRFNPTKKIVTIYEATSRNGIKSYTTKNLSYMIHQSDVVINNEYHYRWSNRTLFPMIKGKTKLRNQRLKSYKLKRGVYKGDIELMQGIDYFAWGAPHWKAFVNDGVALHFESPGAGLPVITPINSKETEEATGNLRFTGETESAKLTMILSNFPAYDSLEKCYYPMSAEIHYDDQVYYGPAIFIQDIDNLDGEWQLTFMEGAKHKLTQRMMIDVNKRTAQGSTGCNQFTGQFETRGLTFKLSDRVAMTRKFCADSDENLFIRYMTDELKFKAVADEIQFFKGDKMVMLWKRR